MKSTVIFGFTAIEYFIIITIVFSLLFLIFSRRLSWVPITILVVALSVLAFYVVPNDTDDLARYFETLNYMKQGGREVLQHMKDMRWNGWDDFPVYAEYFYFISRLPSVHYLSAVTIFISYGLMYLIIYRAANRFHVGKGYLYVGCMFFLSTYWYYDTLSGIRNGLVFAVIMACLYTMLVEKRHIVLGVTGCILAVLFHSAGVILIAIAGCAVLTRKIGGRWVTPITLAGIVMGPAFLGWLSEVTESGFFDVIAEKADRHATGVGFLMQTNFIVNVVVLLVSVLMFIYLRWYFKVDIRGKDLDLFIQFSTITAFFMLGSVTNPLIFLRLARWVVPVVMAIFFMVGAQIQSDMVRAQPGKNYNYEAIPPERWRYQNRYTILVIFCLFIAVHYYYLCAGSSLNWMHF